MADVLVSPRRMTGAHIHEMLEHHWSQMRRTRENAEAVNTVVAGEDEFVMPVKLLIAGADQYVAGLPHPQTVPSRILQNLIAKRPHLSIPLGPKGLGITPQRLTTKVEQPLNAICDGAPYGFQWARACALMAFHGWAAGITVVDPADWQKHPSQWEDGKEKDRVWKKRYRVDRRGRSEDDDGYEGVDDRRAENMAKMDLDIHRARNVPIRHRAISIEQCAPVFGPDLSVEGLYISQEYSTSWLRRHYDFGDTGLATPTGGNSQDSTGNANPSVTGGTLTLIEAWLKDEDDLPYVSYCVKGQQVVEARWKGRGSDYDGKLATLDLKDRFGISRLPVHWEFGLGNPAETNPDRRAMGILDPMIPGWKSARTKMTMMNLGLMFGSLPILIETPEGAGPMGTIEEDDEPETPDLAPLQITRARPGTRLEQLKIQPFPPQLSEGIALELGATMDESLGGGKSNPDQSGFSQSLAAGFEEQGTTEIRKGLGRLYEMHGSFVLEAGKRMPEEKKYASIMVFASTDVPTSDNPDTHNEPMELSPDLIDETFTAKARYTKSMSIPEEQQSMESVARNLKTRRRHLEDTGDDSPETTELELIAEQQRGTPEFSKYILGLVAKIQGAEELADIAAAQDEGLANAEGVPAGFNQGVAPVPPPGVLPPPGPETMPGVPADGSVTGMGAPQYGQAALSGVVGGGGMVGPINTVTQAGGVLPPTLPAPGVGPV